MKQVLKITAIIILAGLLDSHNLFAQTDALSIDALGRVGIGTTTPGYNLTIAGSDNVMGFDNKAILYARNSAQQYEPFLWPRWNDNKMYINYGSAGFVIRNNAHAVTMFMSPAGNVGIGADNPVNKLQLGGNLHMDGNIIYLRKNADDYADLIKWNSSTDRVDIAGWNGVMLGYTNNNNKNIIPILTATNAGTVGIGTTAPEAKLHVVGNIFTSIKETNNSNDIHNATYRGSTKIGMLSGEFTGMELETRAHKCGNGGIIKFYTWGCNTDYSREVMRIDERGWIGIGTNNPACPLEVKGFENYDLGGGFYFMFKDACRQAGGGSHVNSITIRASNGIQTGSGFYCTSDKRIKKNIVTSDNTTDLEKVNSLRIVDFQYKDFVTYGTKNNKGLIAQEVEKVFPQSVTKEADFIPNIYAIPDNVVQDKDGLTITMKEPHNLITGDIVRFITDRSENKDASVIVLNDKTFRVNAQDIPASQLFVYGKKVDDYRVVEYQQVFAMGISAIQQLSKEIDALKQENETLKEQHVVSKSQLKQDRTEIAGMESRLEKLEAYLKVTQK
jgi:hypothetical protein